MSTHQRLTFWQGGQTGQTPQGLPSALSPESANADPIARQWAALVEAASVLARLACARDSAGAARSLPFDRLAPPRRRMAVEQAMDDLAAVMGSGLKAVLTVQERGGNARPAAQILWQEFVMARQGLLALAGAA